MPPQMQIPPGAGVVDGQPGGRMPSDTQPGGPMPGGPPMNIHPPQQPPPMVGGPAEVVPPMVGGPALVDNGFGFLPSNAANLQRPLMGSAAPTQGQQNPFYQSLMQALGG